MNTEVLEPTTANAKKPSTPSTPGCPGCGQAGCEAFLQAPDRFHGRQRIYQLLRCPSCSLVWLENPPEPEQMSEHYGPDYDRSVTEADESSPDRWEDRKTTLLPYKRSGAILDLGCSSGGFLSSLPGSEWKRYGIEMSAATAMRARSKSNAEIFVGDILDAPFQPAMFDAITCFHVYEHIYQPREVLAKVSQWLKPGGIFYVNVPNIDSAGAHIFKSYWYALELPRHLFHYSPASLRYLAHEAGLDDVAVWTQREVFIEASTRYILDQMFRNMGFPRIPLAQAHRPVLAWRVVRKGLRLTALPVLSALASVAGDGESIHGIFSKPKA